MTATTLNLTIEQGATFAQAISLGTSAYDGQAARATIRRRFGDPLIVALTCSAIASGAMTLSLTAAQTAAITTPVTARRYQREAFLGVYDLEAVANDGTVTRLCQGEVTLSLESTT